MEKEQQKTTPLINELTQGKELACQLKYRLDETTSLQSCEFLVEKILFSYEKALSLLNWRDSLVGEPSLSESSPGSENSDPDSQDHHQFKKNGFKKRKTMPKWSEQIRVCSGTVVEGPLGDGYSWRKYGQKDILGATFPRAYYRCTHRNIQGCLATKQVQRSDEDPSIFEINYRGRHTCIQASQLTTALALVVENKNEKPNKAQEVQNEKQKQWKRKFTMEEEIFPSFSFPSTPTEPESTVENLLFSGTLKEDDSFMGSYSPSFISPAHNLQSSGSDLPDIISATNSPTLDWEFSLDHVDFNSISNFPFDITTESEFFS